MEDFVHLIIIWFHPLRRLRSIRNFVAYPNSGIDDADGTFVTKSEFLQVPSFLRLFCSKSLPPFVSGDADRNSLGELGW